MLVTYDEMQRIRTALPEWGRESGVFIMLDSNEWAHDPYGRYEWMAARGARAELVCQGGTSGDPFDALRRFREDHPGWAFGFLGYDLKNRIEDLRSRNPGRHGFPDLYFFQPEVMLLCRRHADGFILSASDDDPERLVRSIVAPKGLSDQDPSPTAGISVAHIGAEAYREAFERVQWHIHRGDIYEANLCMEFSAECPGLDPYALFSSLRSISPMPFSAFLRLGDEFLVSLSPERFMRKTGTRLLSQPMKGTIQRSPDPIIDAANREMLRNSEKERSENIMITDLVRNDLGRSAATGSVAVSKLCEIIPFPGVWQMISTVGCELKAGMDAVDALRHAFPMGSMTGAPKIRAMEIIDELESFRRGLFSGSVGYFDPQGDFDFNVVIRSLLFSKDTGRLSFPAGGAITSDSAWEQEYRECLLKAGAIHRALTGQALSIP